MILLIFFQFGEFKGQLICWHLANLAEGLVAVFDFNDVMFDW